MEKKKKNYKLRSKVYKASGNGLVFLTTFGAWFGYESAIDWSNFKNELGNFIVVSQESLKINLAIAFPLLMLILLFSIIYKKKNSDFFKDKISFSLFIAILVMWIIYSTVEIVLIGLIGAFAGVIVDEVIFTPMSKKAKLKADDDHEIAMEERKISVRKKAREDIDGTV